jgi:alanine dehydrogenase
MPGVLDGDLKAAGVIQRDVRDYQVGQDGLQAVVLPGTGAVSGGTEGLDTAAGVLAADVSPGLEAARVDKGIRAMVTIRTLTINGFRFIAPSPE